VRKKGIERHVNNDRDEEREREREREIIRYSISNLLFINNFHFSFPFSSSTTHSYPHCLYCGLSSFFCLSFCCLLMILLFSYSFSIFKISPCLSILYLCLPCLSPLLLYFSQSLFIPLSSSLSFSLSTFSLFLPISPSLFFALFHLISLSSSFTFSLFHLFSLY
jgi:hypothetical protein